MPHKDIVEQIAETPYFKELYACIMMLALEDCTLPDGREVIMEEARLWSVMQFITDRNNYEIGNIMRTKTSLPKRYNLRQKRKVPSQEDQFLFQFLPAHDAGRSG